MWNEGGWKLVSVSTTAQENTANIWFKPAQQGVIWAEFTYEQPQLWSSVGTCAKPPIVEIILEAFFTLFDIVSNNGDWK